MDSNYSLWQHLGATQKHSYHIVTKSPWPILAALGVFSITIGLVMLFHMYKGAVLLELGILLTLFIAYNWWTDITRESTLLGYHTIKVVTGLRLGMVLFIISEVMFFFSFFWAFFHSSLSPHVNIGSSWPPLGILILNPLEVPLINTYILLLSGVFVTISHYILCLTTGEMNISKYVPFLKNWYAAEISVNFFAVCIFSLVITIILAIEFTILQGFEYYDAFYCINDGIYGTTFYLTTGFHGVHVIVGTIFLSIMLVRLIFTHLLTNHHFGFEASIWYWHFVDVVWLFLYIFLYCWGSGDIIFSF